MVISQFVKFCYSEVGFHCEDIHWMAQQAKIVSSA